MSKTYLVFILVLFTCAANAQTDTLMQYKLKKIEQLTSIAAQTHHIMIESRKIAENALTEKPAPIQTISSEGRLAGDPIKNATQQSIKDFDKIFSLALAYNITKDKKYLDKATVYLLAWARLNKPEGNPINDTNLDQAIEGYMLIRGYLSRNDDQMITDWLKTVAREEMISFFKNQQKEISRNNWNSHRLKILVQITQALDDPSNQPLNDKLIRQQLDNNLLPDGSSIDFRLRDALHYHVYDLEPLLKLAIIIKETTGFDYYTYQTTKGASIKKSVEWLVPYLRGEKKHEEYVHSTVKFDSERARNGEEGFKKGTMFDPAKGLKVLALAGYFDPSYDLLYRNIKGDVLNNADWQLLYRLLILQ